MNKIAILHTILLVGVWLMMMVPNSSFDNEQQQTTDGEPIYTSVCYLTDIDKTDKFLWTIPQRCSQLILSQQLLSDRELAILFRSLLPLTQAHQVDTNRGRVVRSSTATPQQLKPQAQLTLLDLSWNTMGSDAAQSLVQYILSEPSIEYLYVGQNPLSERDLILIANGLRTRDFKNNLHVYMEGLHITDAVASSLQKALENNLHLVYLALDNADLTDAGAKILYNAVTMRSGSVNVSHKKLVLCELQALKEIKGEEDEKSMFRPFEKENVRFRASVRRKQAAIELSNYAKMNASTLEVLRMCFGVDKERVLRELMQEYDMPSEMELTAALEEFLALLLPMQIESTRALLCLCDELAIRLMPGETSFPSVCNSSDLAKMRTALEREIDTEREKDYQKIMKSFDWDVASTLGIDFSSEQDLPNQKLNEHRAPVMPSPRFDVPRDL